MVEFGYIVHFRRLLRRQGTRLIELQQFAHSLGNGWRRLKGDNLLGLRAAG
jgi:hypothetical protein